MSKPEEKRRAHRSRHNSVVEIFNAEGNLLIGTARLVDFSSVGICIAGALKVEKGDILHARVRLLREGIFDLTGCVVWIRHKPHGRLYGISIESTKPIPR